MAMGQNPAYPKLVPLLLTHNQMNERNVTLICPTAFTVYMPAVPAAGCLYLQFPAADSPLGAKSIHKLGSLKDTFCNHLKHVAFSIKIKGNHHLQGNVQVYNVRILRPSEALYAVVFLGWGGGPGRLWIHRLLDPPGKKAVAEVSRG